MKLNSSGTSPPGSEYRYLAAAISMSNVHASGIRKPVAPVNAGSSTSTSAQRKLLVVWGQRSGAPNISTSRSFVSAS